MPEDEDDGGIGELLINTWRKETGGKGDPTQWLMEMLSEGGEAVAGAAQAAPGMAAQGAQAVGQPVAQAAGGLGQMMGAPQGRDLLGGALQGAEMKSHPPALQRAMQGPEAMAGDPYQNPIGPTQPNRPYNEPNWPGGQGGGARTAPGQGVLAPDAGSSPDVSGSTPPGGATPPPSRALTPEEERLQGYEGLVQTYMEGLQEPQEMPQREPLSPAEALGVIFNPEQAPMIMDVVNQRHADSVRDLQFNLERKGQAAQMASGLAERGQARMDKTRQENMTYELAAANAGNAGYPYTIPGMKELAGMRERSTEALTDARERSGASGRPLTPTFKDLAGYRQWIRNETQGAVSQLANLQQQAATGMADPESQQQLLQEAQSQLDYYKMLEDSLNFITDPDDAMRFANEMTEDQQRQFLDAMQAGPTMSPSP